jgi:hypothetical protein
MPNRIDDSWPAFHDGAHMKIAGNNLTCTAARKKIGSLQNQLAALGQHVKKLERSLLATEAENERLRGVRQMWTRGK